VPVGLAYGDGQPLAAPRHLQTVPAILGLVHPDKRSRPKPSEWPTHRLGGETRNIASCGTFLAADIAVELAEQSVPVFLGPVG
jgi:hypothetical protein